MIFLCGQILLTQASTLSAPLPLSHLKFVICNSGGVTKAVELPVGVYCLTVPPLPSKYRITFTGPASVLHQTRRYGVNFARFLPALLACKGWEMIAIVKTPWDQPAKLVLSAKDGFSSHLPSPEEFDSTVEESFAKKFGQKRKEWQLIREGEILHHHQKTFVPDFTFRHDSGTEVLMEIVGFWTPEYLAHRRSTLQRFRDHRILTAIPESSLQEHVSVGDNVIVYKTALKLKPVMEALERQVLPRDTGVRPEAQ